MAGFDSRQVVRLGILELNGVLPCPAGGGPVNWLTGARVFLSVRRIFYYEYETSFQNGLSDCGGAVARADGDEQPGFYLALAAAVAAESAEPAGSDHVCGIFRRRLSERHDSDGRGRERRRQRQERVGSG